MDFGPAVYPGSWPGLGRVRGWIPGGGEPGAPWVRGFEGSWAPIGSSCVRGSAEGFVGFVDGFLNSWVLELVGGFVGSWIGSSAFGFVW